MIIGTISTFNHVPRALVLAKSIKTCMPRVKVVLCLIENHATDELYQSPYLDSVVLAKDLGIPHIERFLFKNEINQASFAMKSMLLEYLFRTYDSEEQFVYLDTDIKVYSPFYELKRLLKHYSIVLTPHIISPLKGEEHPFTLDNMYNSISWRELGAIKTGLYNAGFIALRRSEDSQSFLRWWKYRVERYCYCDYANGINFDQKWLDLVPSLFHTHILRHPGYNMAYWNLSERTLRERKEGYTVNGAPLRFFHFSSVGGTLDMMIKRCYPDPQESKRMFHLLQTYSSEVKRIDQQGYQDMPWSYNYFSNGEKILSKSRKQYMERQETYDQCFSNPFDQSNETIAPS